MTETDYCEIDYSTIYHMTGEQIWACNYHNKVFSDAEGIEKVLCDECKEQITVDVYNGELFCENCDVG